MGNTQALVVAICCLVIFILEKDEPGFPINNVGNDATGLG